MNLPTPQDLVIDQKSHTVLVRVDFNVPFKEDGSIADLARIAESLPTLRFLLQKKASIVLLSHLGRPKGQRTLEYSLKPCAKALAQLLNKPVFFTEDCLGAKTKQQVSELKPTEILLLENLRFYPAEEDPSLDPHFAKELSSYGDFYVNDAFAACHRSHASITSLPSYFPGKSAAGFLVLKEIEALEKLQESPPRPFHAIIGGSKVSSKLGVLQKILSKADSLYIGGAMAFTFYKALGYSIGNSLYEPDLVQTAALLIETCRKKNIPLLLPEDILEGDAFSKDSSKKTISISKEGISPGWYGLDIGPKTLHTWKSTLEKAGSIFWNGPVGVFEFPSSAQGTLQLATFLSKLSSYRVIGGGDTAAAIHELQINQKFTHISTGGGASLEFLEYGTLPGIKALYESKLKTNT